VPNVLLFIAVILAFVGMESVAEAGDPRIANDAELNVDESQTIKLEKGCIIAFSTSDELQLDVQRDAIISLHQHVKHCASKVVDEEFETYEKRHIIHNMLENPRTEIDMGVISQQLNLGATQAEAIMDEVKLGYCELLLKEKALSWLRRKILVALVCNPRQIVQTR
jgi:hypothetical protein